MSEDSVTSVSFKLPLFVAIAFLKLSNFLEAIQATYWTAETFQFNPDTRDMRHDPDNAEVTFEGYGNSSITFHFRYRPGEEGTMGSLNQIDRIVYRSGENFFEFEYLEHHCGCGHCHGMKYPYRPVDVPRHSFESYSEEARKLVIRNAVGGVR